VIPGLGPLSVRDGWSFAPVGDNPFPSLVVTDPPPVAAYKFVLPHRWIRRGWVYAVRRLWWARQLRLHRICSASLIRSLTEGPRCQPTNVGKSTRRGLLEIKYCTDERGKVSRRTRGAFGGTQRSPRNNASGSGGLADQALRISTAAVSPAHWAASLSKSDSRLSAVGLVST